MKRLFCLASLGIALLFVCTPAWSQDRNVTILNFANDTGDESGTTMAATAQGIVTTGIRYIGKYKIIPTPSFRIGTDAASLKEYADLTNSEFVIFGKLAVTGDGSIKIENSLYSRADDSVFKEAETAESALDVFSASDAISAKILSKLYKTNIVYGSLSIKAEGGKGAFDVYVNDVLAGSNVSSIAGIPNGEKQIRVISRSGKDDGKILFNDKVFIKPNASTPISVSFQDVAARVAGKTDKGLLTITSEPSGVDIRIDGGDALTTPFTVELAPGTHQFEPVGTYIHDRYYGGEPLQWVAVPAGSETVIPLKLKEIPAKLDTSLIPPGYVCRLDDREFTPGAEPMDITAGYYLLDISKNNTAAIYKRIWIAPDSTMQIRWGESPMTAFEVPEQEIKFKANADSWDSILPIYRTDTPRFFGGSARYGITSVKFARDKRYIYWHVEFQEANPLVSVPRDTGGEAIVQMAIVYAQPNKFLNTSFCSNANNDGFGYWDEQTKEYQNLPPRASRVGNKTSFTGRLELATIKNRVIPDQHRVLIQLAAKDWKYSQTVDIGYVDFSFLSAK